MIRIPRGETAGQVGKKRLKQEWVKPSQPGWDIPLAMKDAPDIQVLNAFHIKNQIGVPGDRPTAQVRQAQFVSMAQGTGGGVAPYMSKGALKRGDEAQSGLGRSKDYGKFWQDLGLWFGLPTI